MSDDKKKPASKKAAPKVETEPSEDIRRAAILTGTSYEAFQTKHGSEAPNMAKRILASGGLVNG